MWPNIIGDEVAVNLGLMRSSAYPSHDQALREESHFWHFIRKQCIEYPIICFNLASRSLALFFQYQKIGTSRELTSSFDPAYKILRRLLLTRLTRHKKASCGGIEMRSMAAR